MISVDDHVTEPPNVWKDRVPAKFLDQAPRVLEEDTGEFWVYEERRKPVREQGSRLFDPSSGKRDLVDLPQRYSEMRAGCYDARAKDMDTAHVLSSLCFPSFPRFCGQEFLEGKDRELASICVTAYNDWMIDEWSAAAPGRYIPMIILPLWDPAAAAAEIERCATKGAKAIAFTENPHFLGLPSIHDRDLYWDPVFRSAADCGLPLCIHIGSSSRPRQTSPDAPFFVPLILTPTNAEATLVDWLFSGIWVRYPALNVCLSEGGIGWMPYILERAEHMFEFYGPRARAGTLEVGFSGYKKVERYEQKGAFDVAPRELFKQHVFGCFIDDVHGAQSIREIGVENVMAEVDYPHADSTWPRSIDLITAQIGHLNPTEVDLVLQGNARRVFQMPNSI
jgi:hypothetical protein